MNRHTRGDTITFTATNFLTSAGLAATPSTVTVYLDYPSSSRARSQTTVALTNSSGTWTGTWDSEVAFAGTVYVSLQAVGTTDFALDTEFQLTANVANLDPT